MRRWSSAAGMPRLKASKKASVSCFARPAPCQADAMLHNPVESPHLPRLLFACELAVHVHVHVKLPSRQDAQPQVPWRHNVEGAKCELAVNQRTEPRGLPASSLHASPVPPPPSSPPPTPPPTAFTTAFAFQALDGERLPASWLQLCRRCERCIRVFRPRRTTDAHPKSGGRNQVERFIDENLIGGRTRRP